MATHSIKLGSTTYELAPKKLKPSTYSSSTNCPLLFVTSIGDGSTEKTVYTDSQKPTSGLYYNPSDNKLYCSNGFYEYSDERLKTILKPVTVNLEKLSKLRKVYFYWKEGNNTTSKQLGMIAQDVQKLYPELVSTNEDTGKLSLSYEKLSVIALEAIDVLYQENKQIKERLNTVENKYTDLEEKFIDLEYKFKQLTELIENKQNN